jgi:hypothetical protein
MKLAVATVLAGWLARPAPARLEDRLAGSKVMT